MSGQVLTLANSSVINKRFRKNRVIVVNTNATQKDFFLKLVVSYLNRWSSDIIKYYKVFPVGKTR